jgi:hypothetical protein
VPSLITLKEFVDDEEAVDEEATSTVSIRKWDDALQSDPNNRNAEWYAATDSSTGITPQSSSSKKASRCPRCGMFGNTQATIKPRLARKARSLTYET